MKKEVQGYQTLIEELQEKYPLNQSIEGGQNKNEFVRLYGKILRLKNILSAFEGAVRTTRFFKGKRWEEGIRMTPPKRKPPL